MADNIGRQINSLLSWVERGTGVTIFGFRLSPVLFLMAISVVIYLLILGLRDRLRPSFWRRSQTEKLYEDQQQI